MMNLIQDEVNSLNSNVYINSFLIFIERKTGLKRDQFTYYTLSALAIWLTFGWKRDFLCNFIVFIISAYASLLTIGSPVTVDDTKWLVYWIIYALFGFLEYFHYDLYRTLLFYWLVKCIFFIWLMIPGPRGGTNVIYYQIIRRLLNYFQFNQEIDILKLDLEDLTNESSEALMIKQNELKAYYDDFPNIDDAINETSPNIKEAKTFTESILGNLPSGDVNDVNTIWHILNKLFGNKYYGCLFYDSENGINLHNASANLADISSEDRPFVLTLDSSEGLGNIQRVNNKEDELKIVQLLTSIIQQNQSHPIIEDITERLSKAYGVNKKSVIIKNVYVGSFNIVYTVMDLSLDKIQSLTELSEKLKKQFRRFLRLKIHPLLFRPSFDVSYFDKRGNNVFHNQNQTFPIGPPGRTQLYTQAAGWTRYGLKVLGKYKDDNWLHPFQDPRNWYRAFHGTGNAQSQDFGNKDQLCDAKYASVDALANIYKTGFRLARVAACGPGVYCSPNPKFPEQRFVHAVPLDTQSGKKSFKCMLQVAVNPDGVKIASTDIWVVPDPESIRPYGILIKEA